MAALPAEEITKVWAPKRVTRLRDKWSEDGGAPPLIHQRISQLSYASKRLPTSPGNAHTAARDELFRVCDRDKKGRLSEGMIREVIGTLLPFGTGPGSLDSTAVVSHAFASATAVSHENHVTRREFRLVLLYIQQYLDLLE
eukprot:1219450-Amorphochlora_amoeboformis.AAC.2